MSGRETADPGEMSVEINTVAYSNYTIQVLGDFGNGLTSPLTEPTIIISSQDGMVIFGLITLATVFSSFLVSRTNCPTEPRFHRPGQQPFCDPYMGGTLTEQRDTSQL